MGKSPKNHSSVVDAITVIKQNNVQSHVFTGGRDSKISVLDAKTLTLVFQIDCNQFTNSVSSMPRAIAVKDKNLYVGTFGSELWKMNLDMTRKAATNP